MDLAAVRTSLGTFVGPDTAIVGHGSVPLIFSGEDKWLTSEGVLLLRRLENDLMALRLVHFNVIDTAIVRPSFSPSRPSQSD